MINEASYFTLNLLCLNKRLRTFVFNKHQLKISKQDILFIVFTNTHICITSRAVNNIT